MKRIASIAGLILSAACLLLFIRVAAAHWNALRSLKMDGTLLSLLFIAMIVYIATYASSALSWQMAMKLVGGGIGYLQSLRILMVSQLAKYLPGNVGQHIGRVVLAQRADLPASQVIASLLLEMAFLLAAAALCSLAALKLLVMVMSMHGEQARMNLSVAALAILVTIALLALLPMPRRRTLAFVSQYSRLTTPAGARLAASVLLTQVANFVLGAFALWLTVRASVAGHALPLSFDLLGIYSIAWLAGFLVPGAPAGLGIREALLVYGLSTLYGDATAVTATTLFRATTVAGDGISFAAGIALRVK